jgi:hypothetical protein
MEAMRCKSWGYGLLAPITLSMACYGGLHFDREAEGSTDDAGDQAEDDELPEELHCDGEIVDPGPNLVRRLTVDEYINTVHALLDVDVEVEARQRLPPELRADGFTNTASGLITTLAHVEAYEELAELAVSRIPAFDAFVAGYTSCMELQDACERELVTRLGLEVFRRPLRSEEIDALVPVFATAEAEGEGFVVGAGLVLRVMLQAPPFLYRLEDETSGNQVRALDGWEMASRLSYLLWAGPPDAVLLEAAGDDALGTEDEIVAQVDRMLAHPRAREASLAFVRDWLHLSRLDHLPRDPDRFPTWSTDIGQAMKDETSAFFESVAWDQDRALVDLYNASETWLTPELAEHYGLEPMGTGIDRYDLADRPERGGLLTQGSLLTVGGDDSSMVSRGLFVLETLLCAHLQSPPPGVDTTQPDIEPGKSQRFYSEERTTNPSCAGCHRQIEPLSWGLERFVADGTYRLEDWHGNALREDGYIHFVGEIDEHHYETLGEMMDLLAQSDQVRDCMGRKVTQFAIGRSLLPTDQCSVDQALERFAGSPGTWRDVVLAVTLSPGFRTIAVEQAS